MEKPVLEKQVGDYTCRVFLDEDPQSPEDWDHLGSLMTFHRDCYIQTDKRFARKEEQFKEFLRENEKDLIIYPVHAYIHSGVVLSLNNTSYPFNDRWDACQIGVIYCTKAQARKEFGKNYKAKVLKNFEGTIACWNQYESGEVYGFTVEDKEGNTVDSCWGYYDTAENTMLEAVSSARVEKEIQFKKHGEQLNLIKA